MNRLTSVQRDEEADMSDQFGYSLDGQLTSADYGLHWANGQWGNPTRAVDYTLDKAGNRTGTAGVTADGTAFGYQPNGLNQYTSAHSGTVGNGANHEITTYSGVSYSYLNDTRLAEATYTDVSGPHPYKLGYDALGRCVRRTTGGSSTTYYIYDGERPIYEFDSGGGTPSTNVYGRGIDEVIARSNHGAGQYPMQDREGSVVLVTGGDGTILESYRYDAFGTPTMKKPDGTVITTGASLINNRFLFTGREYAPAYGFYEYRARAYHPGIGRFMSEDPSLFVRGMALGKASDKWTFEAHPDEAELNLFRYCNNDPWDLVDPMGLAPLPANSILEAAAIRELPLLLALSESNSDRRAQSTGWERARAAGLVNNKAVLSERINAAYEGVKDQGPQKIFMPDIPGGKLGVYLHNHTSMNKDPLYNTLTSKADRDVANQTHSLIYTTARKPDGSLHIERYRPSDFRPDRIKGINGVTEQKVGDVWKKIGN